MRKIKGKKGAEMTVGTLVIIVLAIIVLVVLAVGFGAGWSNLWEKIVAFLSPANVDTIKNGCQVACTTNSLHDYCCIVKSVRLEKGGEKIPMTCNNDVLKGDCTLDCSKASCPKEMICGGGGAGEIKKTCGEGEKEDTTRKLKSPGEAIPKGEKCCVREQ